MATYKAVMRPDLEYASSVWSPIASSTSTSSLQLHHIVTPGFVDRPRWSDCTAGQMDGEAGGNIGLPLLARVMGVGRQQHGGLSESGLCVLCKFCPV